ncbi:unnamed protein product [Trichogramma brassicae]|uniref:GST C-terminal domain-containing protein n=1 Tax=Trichogramma brassicae TaxID=86971 RepID=A0A6H5I2H7_9HYME|nr:unnamed protein product [Trichogramma brassicae]
MVLCGIECVQRISQYLDVSPGKLYMSENNELNTILKTNTYVTGTKKTIADVSMYYSIHGLVNKMSPQEKAEHVHLSRWCDNMQQDEKLRQSMDSINFNMMHLYL